MNAIVVLMLRTRFLSFNSREPCMNRERSVTYMFGGTELFVNALYGVRLRSAAAAAASANALLSSSTTPAALATAAPDLDSGPVALHETPGRVIVRPLVMPGWRRTGVLVLATALAVRRGRERGLSAWRKKKKEKEVEARGRREMRRRERKKRESLALLLAIMSAIFFI